MARCAWLLGLSLATGGCTAEAFTCGSDQECVDGEHAGLCQPQGYCSFPDASCGSGQRFGEHAGSLAGECVSEDGSTGAVTGMGSSDGAETSTGGPSVDDGTTTATTTPPPMTSSTGEASSDTLPRPDLGSRPDLGVPPGSEYGPCVDECAYCLVHGSGHEVCTLGCSSDDECLPVQVEGDEYPTVCMVESNSRPGCVVPCNLDNGSCPLGTECVFIQQGLNACLWPAVQ